MNTTIVLVIACFATLVALLLLARRRSLSARWLKDPAAHLISVDLDAFRNLIDPQEEEFLRTHLPPSDFRRIQRQRMLAATEYVSAVAQNAAVLLRVAHLARLEGNPTIVISAERLTNTALGLRLQAWRSLGVLYFAILLPGRHVSLGRVAERYEQVTSQAVLLGLRYPLRGVSAAL
jgi:hypothetical protein